MKRIMYVITALAVIFLFNAASVGIASAEDKGITIMTAKEFVDTFGVQEIIDEANADTGGHFTDTNVNGDKLNVTELNNGFSQGPIYRNIQKYGNALYIPAWGSFHGDNSTNGQSRYLGYTYYGEDFTNPAFPHDAWAGGKLEDRNWIKEPWNDNRVKNNYAVFQSDYDITNNDFLKNMQFGLYLYYKDVIAGKKQRPDFWGDLQNYVHVLTPPSAFTWGLGRMWHQAGDGSIWYISIPIAPTMLVSDPDLSASIEPKEVQANPGDEVTFTVTVNLKDIPTKTRMGRIIGYPDWDALICSKHIVGNQDFAANLAPIGGSPELNIDSSGVGVTSIHYGKELKYTLKAHAQNISSVVRVGGDTGFFDEDTGNEEIQEDLVYYEDANPANNFDEAKIIVKTVNLKVVDITLAPNPGEPGKLTDGKIIV
ncbi:MAG: hypothetical protein K6T65_16615, partial [Peptococcaceae bacterium]|nr:hypothetical protein [Peptococcaceae bacterium]